MMAPGARPDELEIKIKDGKIVEINERLAACNRCGITRDEAVGEKLICRGRSGSIRAPHDFECEPYSLSPLERVDYWKQRCLATQADRDRSLVALHFQGRTINEQQRELNRLANLLRESRSPEEISALEAFDRLVAWLEHEAESGELSGVLTLHGLFSSTPDSIERALMLALDEIVIRAYARYLEQNSENVAGSCDSEPESPTPTTEETIQ